MGLSQRDYAAHRKSKKLPGTTLKAVQDALETGRILRDAAGKIDPVEADRLWLERTDATKSRPKPPLAKARCSPPPKIAAESEMADGVEGDGDTSFFEAQRQREWIRVQRERWDLDQKKGRTVELPPINAWAAGMILKAREELLRIGPELRDKLAQETDPIACEQMVAKRVQQALNALSEYRPKA